MLSKKIWLVPYFSLMFTQVLESLWRAYGFIYDKKNVSYPPPPPHDIHVRHDKQWQKPSYWFPTQVLERLKTVYGDMYHEKNVAISGTHTHSGVAGYFQYFLFTITSSGFIHDSYDNLVDGIYRVCTIIFVSFIFVCFLLSLFY